jgi:hypothetical protein
MTTQEEQDYCRRYVQTQYTGEGEILELGPWLGSLTIPMATGLLRREYPIPHRKIHTVDTFIWQEWMNKHADGMLYEFKVGELFLKEFIERIGWLAPLVVIYRMELEKLLWDKKIEFLCIDAMKSRELADAILAKYYTYLIPDVSVVFHQDFKYSGCPWIPEIHSKLKDYFKIIYDAPNSCGVAFKNIKSIPEKMLTGCVMGSYDK